MVAIPVSVRNVYRRIMPVQVQRSLMVKRLKTILPHDMIYNSEYYADFVEGPAARSAKTISDSIIAEFAPRSIVDVGCGTGALLEALREHGCEVFGLEYSEEALKYCGMRRLKVVKFDLEKDVIDQNWAFDVAISMEVAEHLPQKIADRYVYALTHLAPTIVFTAARPGQEGSDHVNLQPKTYWISKFLQHGFEHTEALSQSTANKWKESGDVESWYYENLMIFQRSHV